MRRATPRESVDSIPRAASGAALGDYETEQQDTAEHSSPPPEGAPDEPAAAAEPETLTLFQWIERLSYRFLGPAFTGFVIRRRFVLTRLLLVFVYWVVGVQYYCKEEGWEPVDAAYFITVTTTTVGYGDLHPTNDNTRLFTIFYAVFGIAFVLTAVNDIINYLIVRKLQTRVLGALNVTNIETRAWFKLIFSLLCILTMIAVGTTFFRLYEDGWTTTMALYWTIITMLTIGYGDLTISESSRAFSIWFIWSCVVIYIMAISNILDTFEELKNAALRKEILRAHRVDILELLENDKRDRETMSANGTNNRGLLWRHSLAAIYPSAVDDNQIKYADNTALESFSKGDVELALSSGAAKPTISPLMNNTSLKALFKPVVDSHNDESESSTESEHPPPPPPHSPSGSIASSPALVFSSSRGSIEPTRNSSIAQHDGFRGSSFYEHGTSRSGGAQRRPTMMDVDVLQSKSDRFVLEMLIKMKKVDHEKDILPLVQHFEAIGVMREEHKDASKETVAKMFVQTLNAEKSTLSSLAATLVGNKKIVVQKRASEIEKTSHRRATGVSADPRLEQLRNANSKKPFQQQQQQQYQQHAVASGGSRLASFFEEISSPSALGDDGVAPTRKHSGIHVESAIAEGDEDEEES